MRSRVLNGAFILHLLAEAFTAAMILYAVFARDMSSFERRLPPSTLEGFDLSGYPFLWICMVASVGITTTLIPTLYALRSPPGAVIRKVALLVCTTYHLGVSICAALAFPEVGALEGGPVWYKDPHLYVGLWFAGMYVTGFAKHPAPERKAD